METSPGQCWTPNPRLLSVTLEEYLGMGFHSREARGKAGGEVKLHGGQGDPTLGRCDQKSDFFKNPTKSTASGSFRTASRH